MEDRRTVPMRLRDMGDETNALTGSIVDAAIEVHSVLGPGLLEKTYQRCLAHELAARGLRVELEVPLPLRYKDLLLPAAYRLDLLVEGTVIVEVKAVDALHALHFAQVSTYLKLTDKQVALLLNFDVPSLKLGMHRIVRA